jgi:hypothetical protein
LTLNDMLIKRSLSELPNRFRFRNDLGGNSFFVILEKDSELGLIFFNTVLRCLNAVIHGPGFRDHLLQTLSSLADDGTDVFLESTVEFVGERHCYRCSDVLLLMFCCSVVMLCCCLCVRIYKH